MSEFGISDHESRGGLRLYPERVWRNCSRDHCHGGGTGFTLIEVVGVVAILAILACLLTPAVIQSMDQAARVRDSSELKTIADAFQSAIRRHAQIPAAANMPGFIATEMGVAPSEVLTNSRNVQRLFFVDPNLALGPGALPYNQVLYPGGVTNGLPRTNLRVLIFSSLSVPLPAAGTFDFNTAWATPDNSTPADWTSWPGKGEDLTIQRVDFTPLLHRVVLNNVGGGSAPSFSVESGGVSSAVMAIPSPLLDTWYLERTGLCLYNSGVLQTKTILQDDASYFFQNANGSWLWLGSLK